MQETAKILEEILKIIEYKGSKEEFIRSFLENLMTLTIVELLLTVDEESANKITQEIEDAHNSGTNFEEIILKYFTEEQVQKAATKVTQENIEDFIVQIDESLDENQQDKIDALIAQYQRL